MTDTFDAVAPPLEAEADARRAEMRARMLKGQEKMRELRATGWKPVVLNPIEKAKANPNSPKAAIKAYCWTCVGTDADPGAKFRVRDCPVGDRCPLFHLRPWQTVRGGVTLTYNEAGEQQVLETGNDEEGDE